MKLLTLWTVVDYFWQHSEILVAFVFIKVQQIIVFVRGAS